jgi:hypothetical protein
LPGVHGRRFQERLERHRRSFGTHREIKRQWAEAGHACRSLDVFLCRAEAQDVVDERLDVVIAADAGITHGRIISRSPSRQLR